MDVNVHGHLVMLYDQLGSRSMVPLLYYEHVLGPAMASCLESSLGCGISSVQSELSVLIVRRPSVYQIPCSHSVELSLEGKEMYSLDTKPLFMERQPPQTEI